MKPREWVFIHLRYVVVAMQSVEDFSRVTSFFASGHRGCPSTPRSMLPSPNRRLVCVCVCVCGTQKKKA